MINALYRLKIIPWSNNDMWPGWQVYRIKREIIFNKIKPNDYHLHSNYKPILFIYIEDLLSTIFFYCNPTITEILHSFDTSIGKCFEKKNQELKENLRKTFGKFFIHKAMQ